jgi:hypothetical protein
LALFNHFPNHAISFTADAPFITIRLAQLADQLARVLGRHVHVGVPEVAKIVKQLSLVPANRSEFDLGRGKIPGHARISVFERESQRLISDSAQIRERVWKILHCEGIMITKFR